MLDEPSKTDEKLRRLRELSEKASVGGGKKRIEEQHARDKLTARERLESRADSRQMLA